MNELEFNNDYLNLKVRAILNDDGSISINAEDTAIGFGWCRTEIKNGKEYHSIMWARMNAYCKELGFAHECAKDDYIPESLFYRLGMKASNAVAEKFQNWLALEVIPSIRKTGQYTKNPLSMTPSEQIQLLAQGTVELTKRLDTVEQDLRNFKEDMPLLGVECQKITWAKNRKVVPLLGGKNSPAYKDRSIRGRVYSDIDSQLRREFGVNTYRAIKRNQIDLAVDIINEYELPICLKEAIETANAQMQLDLTESRI